MHWTYETHKRKEDLCQGDILEPKETLIKLFKEVHPHFIDKKYRGFLLLTQTCDLATRIKNPNQCSATHISLSAIRSLNDIITDSLKEQFGFLTTGVYAQHMKRSVEDLLERIVNQNENKLGLFYLHPDLDSGITVQSVAVLRVAISVRATEHYDTLRKARVGRLSKEFQPKLGWMVGNLYSRVGVQDWKEQLEDQNKDLESDILNEALCCYREKPIWLDRKIYKKILKTVPDFDTLSFSEQEGIIKKNAPPPPEQKALDIIAKTINDVVPKVADKHLEIIKNRLKNNQQFEAQMRRFK